MLRQSSPYLLSCALVLLACGDDGRDSTIYSTHGSAATLDAPEEHEESESAEASSSSDEEDPTTGDGDGDGDPTTGDGDGDGDPTTGDGDGDPTTGGNACGNGVIDPGEECDGANLGGSSCAEQGFDGGVLSCDPIVCVFDTSGCTDDPGNQCDANCNGCTCPSFECTMCCALKDKVDTCGGGSCGCF